MPTPPTLPELLAYLGPEAEASWGPYGSQPGGPIDKALAAEIAAQAAVVRFPADPLPPEPPAPYPADLAEALFRRVSHNLAVRRLPLGVQANISEMAVATTRVGGTDAEVRRLEAPYRRMAVG